VSNLFQDLLDKIFKPKPKNTRLHTVPSKQTAASAEASTAPLTPDELALITHQTQQIEPQQLITGVGRNVGRQRPINEDSVYCHTSIIDANGVSLPFGIFIVADGMGGHKNGDLASEFAVRTMSTHLQENLFTALFGPNPGSPDESIQEIMKGGVFKAHDKINANAPGGGTTLTAVLSIGTQMTIAHVGDSRAYSVYLDGRMQTLTRDHSLVKRLEELGQITAEEAAIHPQKSMLYNALGQGDTPRPDIFTASLPHPGYLMICSDGLWNVVDEEEIFNIITSAASPHEACQNLVDAANAGGGPDNISVILVRMSD
jgi:serine/threonine protein phosphatase PrpC